ncbi:mammalian cell entry protein [Mycobacterium sp. TJFP1]
MRIRCRAGTSTNESAVAGGSEMAVGTVIDPARDESRAVRIGVVFGLMALAAIVVIAGWLKFQVHAADEELQQRAQLLAAGRDGAVLLTTINHSDAEAKVEQILESATGVFLEDFRSRSQSFLATVRRAQSDTAGTVVEAGLESSHGDQANVLVVMSVKTSLAGTAAPPRLWRMRIGVQQVGQSTKVSDVEFLP